MAWIESHQSLRSHPKTLRAARLACTTVKEIIADLHLLWWWAIDYAEDGDLSRHDPLDLECLMEWQGPPGLLISALTECGQGGDPGFLERTPGGRLLIRHWWEHAGKLMVLRQADRERKRAAAAAAKAAAEGARKASSRAAPVPTGAQPPTPAVERLSAPGGANGASAGCHDGNPGGSCHRAADVEFPRNSGGTPTDSDRIPPLNQPTLTNQPLGGQAAGGGGAAAGAHSGSDGNETSPSEGSEQHEAGSEDDGPGHADSDDGGRRQAGAEDDDGGESASGENLFDGVGAPETPPPPSPAGRREAIARAAAANQARVSGEALAWAGSTHDSQLAERLGEFCRLFRRCPPAGDHARKKWVVGMAACVQEIGHDQLPQLMVRLAQHRRDGVHGYSFVVNDPWSIQSTLMRMRDEGAARTVDRPPEFTEDLYTGSILDKSVTREQWAENGRRFRQIRDEWFARRRAAAAANGGHVALLRPLEVRGCHA